MNIARGGFAWIIPSYLITILVITLFFLSQGVIRSVFLACSILLILLSSLLVIFFRDPQRSIGSDLVAVADGKIREIASTLDEDIGECVKISTFMNIHNVHVNRMPLDGTIQELIHHPGAHLPAYTKESERNERVVVVIQSPSGLIKVVLIAGTIARRIVPYISKADSLKKGQKIGVIRLGSRVDIYIPSTMIKHVPVAVGDRKKAGEDTLAVLNG